MIPIAIPAMADEERPEELFWLTTVTPPGVALGDGTALGAFALVELTEEMATMCDGRPEKSH